MDRQREVVGHGGVRLVATEFGGVSPGPGVERPDVLLLHGLMGCSSHWAEAAVRLSPRYRAVALDQRGHGASDKPEDGPYDRDAFVADVEAAVEQLGLAPVVLIGHSMGALTAWQLAARRPDLVAAVVICDMRASALGARSQQKWEEWFDGWPLPFPSRAAARLWFSELDPSLDGTHPSRGAFHADTMVRRADGWRPVFSRRQMLMAREGWVHDAHWEELAQVRCPALVVRGLDGELGRAEAQEMVRVLPRGRYADVPDAGHLVHHDQPAAWHEIVDSFLREALPG
ncbi:alpha/beta hydrolase [Streptomyces sp. ACA25]|uniref:alpha/beta fold hydrolase n=1 Tax=Streptomyces sp. ACA25 TaxID=3022596 RepID=UPI002307B5F5|nr:alpha/beta hydrolase [Streptomyces sp. ACA25]MDB1088167.1 alpha/beta hydrolase [Streptomyces sp. ACA25]